MIFEGSIAGIQMRKHTDKSTKQDVDVADVVVITANPTESFVATIWHKGVQQGDHNLYQPFVGKGPVKLAGRFNVFNGNLSLQLDTRYRPVLASAPVAASSTQKVAG